MSDEVDLFAWCEVCGIIPSFLVTLDDGREGRLNYHGAGNPFVSPNMDDPEVAAAHVVHDRPPARSGR